MGDLTRSCMSRSMHVGSPRKDNAEEVAKRRAAMQREFELRREEARRVQEEKMARAAAHKEERLQKQRELQQKEAQRMHAVQQRRNAAIAEEKMKKAAAIAKAEQAAARYQIHQKTRSLYAFGSSTPRELGYLTQLSKQEQVYDRKLQPSSGGVSSPALNSNRRLSSTPRVSQMTRSMYLPSSDSTRRINGRSVVAAMTRSVYSPQQVSGNSPIPNSIPRRALSRDVLKHRSVPTNNNIANQRVDGRNAAGMSAPKPLRNMQSKRAKGSIDDLEQSKKVIKRENLQKKSTKEIPNLISGEKFNTAVVNSNTTIDKLEKKQPVIVHSSTAVTPNAAVVPKESNENSLVQTSLEIQDNQFIKVQTIAADIINKSGEIKKSFDGIMKPSQVTKTKDSLENEVSSVTNTACENSSEHDRSMILFNLEQKDEMEKHCLKEIREPEQVTEQVTHKEELNEQANSVKSNHATDFGVSNEDAENAKSELKIMPRETHEPIKGMEGEKAVGVKEPEDITTTNLGTEEAHYTDNCTEILSEKEQILAEVTVDKVEKTSESVVSEIAFNSGIENVEKETNNIGTLSGNLIMAANILAITDKTAETAKPVRYETIPILATRDSQTKNVESVSSRETDADAKVLYTARENEKIGISDLCGDVSSAKIHTSDEQIGNPALSDDIKAILEEKTYQSDARKPSGKKEVENTDIDNEGEEELKKSLISQINESHESSTRSKYEKDQLEREERKARLAAIMSRTRKTPTAVVVPTGQRDGGDSVLVKEPVRENDNSEARDTHRFAAASILQKLASSNPQLISSTPHLMSLLQRNGSNPSLAEELSAADRRSPSYEHSKESLSVNGNSTIRSFNNDNEKQQFVAT